VNGDWRFCTICEQFLDITNMTAITRKGGRGGRTTVIDPSTEKAHIVLSKRMTAKKLEQETK
jgi:hypothetical protein